MAPGLVVSNIVKRQHIASKSIRERRRKVKFYCTIVFAILCAALIYVWTRISVVQLGYDISKLSHEVNELTKQKNLAESYVLALKSPIRLEKIAREGFGMRLPKGNEIVFLEP